MSSASIAAPRRAAARPLLSVELSRSSSRGWAPPAREIARWARAAVGLRGRGHALAVRICDDAESRRLNRRWRGKDEPTNVLSFPVSSTYAPAPAVAAPGRRASLPLGDLRRRAEPRPLGDLVIAAGVVAREAAAQRKSRRAHWAHLVVHGSLHLLGFDHERDAEARRMERRERRVLAALGFPDPYSAERGAS